MILRTPFFISSRLMAATVIGDGTLSLALSGRTDHNGRDLYTAWLDLDSGASFAIDDLKSGCHGGSVREGFSALLSFLSAAAESYHYQERTGRPGEYADLFELPVVEWAAEHADELSMRQYELDEDSDEPLIDEDSE